MELNKIQFAEFHTSDMEKAGTALGRARVWRAEADRRRSRWRAEPDSSRKQKMAYDALSAYKLAEHENATSQYHMNNSPYFGRITEYSSPKKSNKEQAQFG